MKGESDTIQEIRPINGCARCVWWLQLNHSSWGRCTVHRENTWWQHAACVEYERDGEIDDAITLHPELS